MDLPRGRSLTTRWMQLDRETQERLRRLIREGRTAATSEHAVLVAALARRYIRTWLWILPGVGAVTGLWGAWGVRLLMQGSERRGWGNVVVALLQIVIVVWALRELPRWRKAERLNAAVARTRMTPPEGKAG